MTVLHEPFYNLKKCWYADVSASTGFGPHERVYPRTVENSGELARLAAHHLPFYEQLHAQRLDVTPWE